MPASIHLVRHPLGADPRPRLAAAYHAADSAAWLVPAPAAVADARRAVLAGRAGVLAPNVLSLQAFADAVVRRHDPAARPLSNADGRQFTAAAVAELRDAGDLTHFGPVADTRGFGAAAETVAELKRAGVGPAGFTTAAAGDRLADAGRLFAWVERQRTRLDRLDPEDRLKRAAVLWTEGRREPFGRVRAVMLDGFRTLTHAGWELLGALTATLDAIWVSSPDEAGDDRAELFAQSRTGSTAWMRRAGRSWTVSLPCGKVPRTAAQAAFARPLVPFARDIGLSPDGAGWAAFAVARDAAARPDVWTRPARCVPGRYVGRDEQGPGPRRVPPGSAAGGGRPARPLEDDDVRGRPVGGRDGDQQGGQRGLVPR